VLLRADIVECEKRKTYIIGVLLQQSLFALLAGGRSAQVVADLRKAFLGYRASACIQRILARECTTYLVGHVLFGLP
jgi:hypothetical protein